MSRAEGLKWGPSSPWSLGGWIYNYLCNRCLSQLILFVRNPLRARCTTLCDKVWQWRAAGRRFSPGTLVSSTYKTDHHDISEILLKEALNTIKQLNKSRSEVDLTVYVVSYISSSVWVCNENNHNTYWNDIIYILEYEAKGSGCLLFGFHEKPLKSASYNSFYEIKIRENQRDNQNGQSRDNGKTGKTWHNKIKWATQTSAKTMGYFLTVNQTVMTTISYLLRQQLSSVQKITAHALE